MVKRFLSTVIIGAMAIVAMAQTNIRYVCNSNGAVKNPSTNAVIGYHVKGAYTNDGKSWATAKDKIQDAINDLKNNNLDGEVWVAQGTYYPTETTESTGGSTLYMSFKIPAGITVRGGFKGMLVNSQDADISVAANIAFKGEDSTDPYDATKNPYGRTKISNSTSSVGYYYPFQSVLDGSISASHKQPKFTWNSTKHQYTTEFYGNCYHVVTFATNGFDSNGRANPLGTTAEISAANGEMAKLEGFMIKNGYAYNSSTDGHPHNAYGGGVYMVPGACLEDVAVENCEASRDGGGVYLDGGGKCVHVYVADCQAVGTSYSSGYGGGICVDENKQVFPPIVKRSATINCVARYGGGIANRVNNPSLKITAGSKTYQMRYNQGFAACVVSGCTALTEGGGIYALNGGSFTHMTVARNACYGSGITVNGMKTGRSAGFYARNNVVMANSILWGGSINDDQTKAAQFASSRSTTDDKAETYYVALSNADRADWTGVKATGTIKLSRYNTAAAESAAGATSNSEEEYVNFLNPLGAAGYSEDAAASHFKAYEKNSTTNNGISYKVDYTSACTNAGVPTTDIDTEGRTPATKDGQTDVFGDEYSSNPTLGAYTSTVPVMGPDVEDTGEDMTTPGGHTYRKGVVHIFVDPNSTYSGTSERLGCSWATPVKSLRDAIEQIDSRAQDLVALIESGTSSVFTGSVEKVVIHVKEGTTTVQGANVSGTIRSTSLEMPNLTVHHTYLENGEQKQETETSNLELEIIGGYKSNITDNIYSSTNTSGYDNTTANFPARHGYAQASVRNPILYPTIITGYVMDDYEYTTPHIFKIEDKGTTPVTIDGLQVRYANATSQKLDNTVTTGAAFTIKNSSAVSLKNVLIADCQASNGAAIYATGNSIVSLENCIIHNNAVNVAGVSGGDFNKGGIIYTESGSSVTLNHCDILRNVGYPFYNDGTVKMDNSISYANMNVALEETNGNGDKALKTFAGSSNDVTTDNGKNLFDTASASDTRATGIGTANQEFVYQDNTDNHYPGLNNPTRNSGVSPDGDATYYGRTTSFQPMNNNEMVNAAAYSGDHSTWGTDMSANITRDYGGLPDIGAVENHKAAVVDEGDIAATDGQPEYGTLYYVKYYDGDLSKGGDGMSWTNAINGNAYYDESTGDFYGSEASHTSASGGHWEYGDPVTTRTLGTATTNIETGKKYLLRKKGESVYAKLGTSNVNVGMGQSATLFTWGTTDGQTADVFTFLQGSYETGWGWNKQTVTAYIINDQTLSRYFQYDPMKGTEASTSYNYYQMTMSGNKIKFHSVNGGWDRYLDIETKSTGGGWNSQNIQVIYQTDNESDGQDWEWVPFTESTETPKTWVEETTTYNHIKGIQYAVNKASQRSLTGYNTEVWVGAGTYKSNLVWKDGANVYGGFPATGSPGKNQRDISNSNATYNTIIDGNASGRVLKQNAAFTSVTTMEGITLQNGKSIGTTNTSTDRYYNNGAGACILANGVLKNCLITGNHFYGSDTYNQNSRLGGGGLYMAAGTVKNCIIKGNYVHGSGNSCSTGTYAVGGGVFLTGGTLINSLIVENEVKDHNTNILGAGGSVQGAATFYNCTVAYNYGRLTAAKKSAVAGGFWDTAGTSVFYNCIFWGNCGNGNTAENYFQVCMPGYTNNAGKSTTNFKNCYHSTLCASTACDATDTQYTYQTASSIASLDAAAGYNYDTFVSACRSAQPFDSNYALLSTASTSVNCINKGLYEDELTAAGITEDITGADRIQDCTVDKGAYEYNGAYDITPTLSSDGKEAYFYVTQNGRGVASASSPATAACYQKLQKVIDAAGRYKYKNSDKRVIVKLAGDASSTGFKYMPCRSTDASVTDQRNWSIIVPRGVEVWGGYTDSYTDDDNNGFTADRDVINHPTYFSGSYTNTASQSSVIAYHVVTFTDNIFDADGTAYKTGDVIGQTASTSGTAITLSASTYGRGIIDGIFITGGMADAVTSAKDNPNVYGGAALVNECGHVRNCVIRSNYANYGGGLALAKGGLVSGCLIDQNTAWYNGGGIYVLTDDENTNIGITSTDKPRVYTSTIVDNSADVLGGGLAFDDKDNVRVSSSVIWQNHCSDMANVSGNYAPEKAGDDQTSAVEYYPIAYTAIQNLRASGTNNLSIATENKSGARFWKHGNSSETALAEDETDFSDFGLYKPTNISALLRVGMPVSTYNSLVSSDGLAVTDFAAVRRDAATQGTRTYVDMGARALDKKINDNELMLRLFVAQAEDVDADAATDFATLTAPTGATTEQAKVYEYYAQQGSSFAYPFQSLQDALDYIYTKRGLSNTNGSISITSPTDNANLLPFEICVAKGTYYPTKQPNGTYGQSYSNTFAIPEGVNIYGGFDINATDASQTKLSNTFYGRYYKAKSTLAVDYTSASKSGIKGDTSKPQYITENVEAVNRGGATTNQTELISGYTIKEATTDELLSNRVREDVNANSIIEPWEFKYQTTLSGYSVGEESNGVFHVISAFPDQLVTGVLPPKSVDLSTTYDKAVTNDGTDGITHMYQNHERGQYSILNGLIITGGTARNFNNDKDMDELSKDTYYNGGGLLADGNVYNDNYNNKSTGATVYKHTGVSDAAAYRNSVLCINQCKFIDNEAGYGGAMSVNNTVDIYNSSFEQNKAIYGEDKNVACSYTDTKGNSQTSVDIRYPGQGGAIYSTYQIAAYNTVFANNEAQSTNYSIELESYMSYRNPNGGNVPMFSGIGGAVYSGFQGHFHLTNCDVVRNMANHYPAVFTRNPNTTPNTYSSSDANMLIADYNQFLNTVAWGNEINPTMVARFSNNKTFKFAASLICNYGAPDRDIWTPYGVNYGSNPTVPTDQEDLDMVTTDGVAKWAETAWFSAYESGRGMTCNNTNDLRDMQLRAYKHVIARIKEANSGSYQNCNIEIDSDNNTLEGPNFSSPSKTAGYDGYNESADWSPARLNSMTDQGTGSIVQEITLNANGSDYDYSFPKYSDLSTSTIDGYWTSQEQPNEAETRALYSNETKDDYITSGGYPTVRYMTLTNYANTLPLGTDNYMTLLTGTSGSKNMYRISPDPNPNVKATYIDIGAYEYPHTQLKPTTLGDQCDILWVSSEEKPNNGEPDGSTWSHPTSDLQRAIETLLSSRNGHRKEIRLMDGTYSPIYTIQDHMSFFVDTKYLNGSVILPTSNGSSVTGHGVKSFTIKGGYSKDLNEQYDVDEYPAIIRQKKNVGNSSRCDNLIYIKDATQRYGLSSYTDGNGQGWWTTPDQRSSKPAPTTIPIEIDGVSIVNNQASDGVNGSAIYYADQTFGTDFVQADGATTYTATAPTSAYITASGSSDDATHTSVEKYSPYKFILSKSIIMNSGAKSKATTTSAAYIGQYGGEALVYNSVFHSNYGKPLDAYATTTVNNTFALNKGMMTLNDYGSYNSTIYNSVFWKNNNGGSQFNLTDYDYIKSNAFTGCTVTTNNNSSLGDNNSDATDGPNFTAPNDSYTGSDDDVIEVRDFKLQPTLRLLNRGDNATANVEAITAGTALYNTGNLTAATPVVGNIYDYAWVTTTGTDAASQPRIVTTNGVIDLGAYEYQSKQNRIIYVDPNKLTSGSGLSWSDPFGYGTIQTAIDACAVAYKKDAKQTYVFVKANSSTNIGQHSMEKLTMRNGVAVYGSVVSDYNVDCMPSSTSSATGEYNYDDATLATYVKDVKVYHRNGIVSPTEGHTRILGITTDGSFDNTNESVIDGFDVTAQTDASSNEMVEVTEPVININPKKSDTEPATGGLKMCIANVAVHGNNLTGTDNNLINIDNALLYEALVYNNKVEDSWAVLKVGNYGYAASVTVEGKTTGADGSTSLNNYTAGSVGNTGTSATDGNTTASHVYNSITNYSGDAATWKTLSGYCYKMDKPALNYQLTEKSKYIDAIDLGTNASKNQAAVLGDMPANLSCFINYWPERSGTTWTKADRDLLGNFRLQTLGTVAGTGYDGNDYYVGTTLTAYQPKLDRGAFETWDIKQSTKNCYPDFSHAGSVEYIRAGKSFIIDGIAEGGNNNPHNPGFVLLEMGANLYGNGRRVEIPYISVESYVSDAFIKTVGTGYVMSAPFKMNYNKATEITSGLASFDKGVAVCGMGQVSYDGNGGLLYNKLTNVDTYTYNGTDRSASDYAFETGVTTQSSCWKSTTGEIPAATGILMVYNSVPSGTIKYRVTAYSGAYETKVYKEEINFNNNHVYHSVPLYKYNDSESTDGGADFTDANDQGWNCIGLPYLVCNYHPYYKAVYNSATSKVTTLAPDDDGYAAATTYAMTNPKTMWLYYNGKVDGDGNRLSPDGTSTTMGDGGFYAVNSWDNTSWHQESGTTPRIWMGEGFFVQNQDWEGDEELKFYVPVAPTLPINAVGSAKKATTESFNTRYYYETDITAPTDNGDERTYKIRVINRTLTVSNLEGGENIRLYNSVGQLLQSAEAESETYKTNVESGVLIVNVNGVSTKFFVK